MRHQERDKTEITLCTETTQRETTERQRYTQRSERTRREKQQTKRHRARVREQEKIEIREGLRRLHQDEPLSGTTYGQRVSTPSSWAHIRSRGSTWKFSTSSSKIFYESKGFRTVVRKLDQ